MHTSNNSLTILLEIGCREPYGRESKLSKEGKLVRGRHADGGAARKGPTRSMDSVFLDVVPSDQEPELILFSRSLFSLPICQLSLLFTLLFHWVGGMTLFSFLIQKSSREW